MATTRAGLLKPKLSRECRRSVNGLRFDRIFITSLVDCVLLSLVLKFKIQVPNIQANFGDIASLKENGVEFPAVLFEAWLDEVYGENGDEIKEVFACPEDTDECNDSLDRFLTSVNWACNSKNALFEIIKTNREYGPIYPMEFRHPTCAAVDGKNTRR